jgi:16S rRNA (cytidine1402-2'-O)-methyltransferase
LSKLLLIPTPIGNLDDVSPRVKSALENADVLLAEDTRHTGKLLSLLGIKIGWSHTTSSMNTGK